ncbi:MAG: hypothetical protein RMI34_10865 [Chloroherpetonaceae bacterium]|nr:hypothetical protein [Chloroherpetonaceae bacterium]MDW8020562.1 hypothetical protein [Chloroherpetonaceae bacterium]
MTLCAACRLFILLSILYAPLIFADSWKGYAILGDGKICGAYSDDERITSVTKRHGLHSLYFQNFTASYVSSTLYTLLDRAGAIIPNRPLDGSEVLTKTGLVNLAVKPSAVQPDVVEAANFFTSGTRSFLADGTVKKLAVFCHPEDAIIFELSEETLGKSATLRQFQIVLNIEPQAAQTVSFQRTYTKGNILFARWSNNTMLGITVLESASGAKPVMSGRATVVVRDRVYAKALRVAIIAGLSEIDIEQKNISLRKKSDVTKDAETYWNNWLSEGKIPYGIPESYLEMFKRNLYAIKAATLNGQVPADLSGYYVANGMPQIYPRDAMMVARVFLQTRHYAEARSIIRFWSSSNVPMKNGSEWYAKYDALLRPTNEGFGVKSDEPHWDLNCYFIKLVDEYRLLRKEREYLVSNEFLYRLADFIVSNIDENGLLYEAGRKEWRGYLPLTNMVSALALRTVAAVADEFADYARAQHYRDVSARISAALPKLIDSSRQIYTNLRLFGPRLQSISSLPQLRFWDTFVNLGAVWGYPNHPALVKTNEFFLQAARGEKGGLRYLEKLSVGGDVGYAPEYSDVFITATAVAAHYQALNQNLDQAQTMLNWLWSNRNSYGLMPERLSVSGTAVGEASPHLWSCAETVAAIWAFFKAKSPVADPD